MDRLVPVPYHPANPLSEIFQLQEALIKQYITIEGLPEYPISPKTKSNQKLLKEFSRRVIEELSETYQSYRDLYQRLSNNQSEGVVENTIDLNMEIADVIHFLVELLIYSGIGTEDIIAYISKGFKGMGLCLRSEEDLTICLQYSQTNLHTFGLDIERLTGFRANLDARWGLIAGKVVNGTPWTQRLLWAIVHQLCTATNILKGNAWKFGEYEVDVNSYQMELMAAWVNLMDLLVYMGLDSEAIYLIYYNKNLINQERIKTKR